MKNTMKRKMTVAALFSVATLATSAGVAHADVVAPYEPEPQPRERPEPKRQEAERPKPEQPDVPQPENGTIAGVSVSTLEAIAACESGGDPQAVNAAGYYGKYQFDLQTWASVGGSGNPSDAPEAEQDYRAALLYAQAGASPWPVCGQ